MPRVRILLAEGHASVNQTRLNDGVTALMIATKDGYAEVVHLLLSYVALVPEPTQLVAELPGERAHILAALYLCLHAQR